MGSLCLIQDYNVYFLKFFLIFQFFSIMDRMFRFCDFNIDVFFIEIDENLVASRVIFRNFDVIFNIMFEEQWEEV